MENIVKKPKMGRQKIEIKKIEKKANLQVAFSQRRIGLFKKVADSNRQFGLDAVVMVESPGGRLFSTETPSSEHVINRYIELNNGDDLKNIVCANVEKLVGGDLWFWWNKPIDDLDLKQLEEFKVALEGFKSNMMARASASMSSSTSA